MPIGWSASQRSRVEAAYRKYPIESSRCADAARDVLPIAKTLSTGARPRKLVGKEGAPFIVPKRKGIPSRFCHHIAVAVVEHDCDALTGADGSTSDIYLDEHWKYPDFIEWVEVDMGDSSL